MIIDRILAALRRAASLPTAIFRRESAAGGFHKEADGGVEFSFRIVAAAAPEIAYGLLDPSYAGNRWVRRGDRIDAVDAARGLYRLTDHRLPDAPFLIQIDEASPPTLIAATILGDGGQPFGAVQKSKSRYSIAPHPDGCEITLTERTYFLETLSARELNQHAQMMDKGVKIDVARLKDEAENFDAPPVAATA